MNTPEPLVPRPMSPPTRLAPGDAPAPTINLQVCHGSTDLVDDDEDQAPVYCLYFLVSAARTGPTTGLFKLGVTDCLPARYYQLTHAWDEFDLGRSVLLRSSNRREVRYLERALLFLFGDPGILAGPDGCPALRASWWRDPGQRESGYKEWFDVGCLSEMLATVTYWLERRGARAADAHLLHGIDPVECALPARTDREYLLTREQRSEQRRAHFARRRRERAEHDAHIVKELPLVLYFAERIKPTCSGPILTTGVLYWQQARVPTTRTGDWSISTSGASHPNCQQMTPKRRADNRSPPKLLSRSSSWASNTRL